MKRIFVLILVLFFAFSFIPLHQEFSFAENTKQIIINTSYSYLYKDSSFDEHYDFKINSNEILVCLDESDSFYKVSYNFEDNNYVGFIPSEFASIYLPAQQTILVYNGKITKNTKVYSITTNEDLDITLNRGHEIYLYEGFNSKKDYTNIKFSYDNNIYVGKVLTNDLSPNGINKGLIIALSVISAIVGVVLILLGLSKTKKWHKLLKFFKK